MADNQREFVVRRERLALQAHLGDLQPTADVDLGNFVAVRAGNTLWVSATALAAGEARTSALAAALAWHARGTRDANAAGSDADAVRHDVTSITIVDAHTPGLTARRAMNFSVPITVLDARTENNGAIHSGGVGAKGAVATPHARGPELAAKPEHLALASAFRDVGADVVVEHGVVVAEVMGLEVARVIDEEGVPTIRIGVGAHDREMFKMVNGTTTSEQLRGVVRTVMQHRRDDAPTHPLNLLAPERALRARVLRNPEIIGVRTLSAAQPPVPRENVKDSVPCCAVGEDEHGPVVTVFVAGIDLDAVPFAADARSHLAPDARLLIVTASRNIVPVQLRIASMLKQPAEFLAG